MEKAPEMLDAHFTYRSAADPAADTAPGPLRELPPNLANLLNPGSAEALIDLLLGPGLILTGIKSLPLFNQRVQIVLRVDCDPEPEPGKERTGFRFVEHVDGMNVSSYSFRLNAHGLATTKGGATGLNTGSSTSDAPADSPDHFNQFSAGPSFDSNANRSETVKVTDTAAIRDTYFSSGPADRYIAEVEVSATLTKTLLPSRLFNSAFLGAPGKLGSWIQKTADTLPARPSRRWAVADFVTKPLPSDLAALVTTRIDPVVTRATSKWRMLERVVQPTEALSDDIMPTVPAGAAAVTAVPHGSTPASLGATPFHLTAAHLTTHGAFTQNFRHDSVRTMFDLSLAGFTGTVKPLGATPGSTQKHSYAVGRLTEAGTAAQDALHYQISVPMLSRNLELMLRPGGLKLSEVVRPGGPFTDTEGSLTIEVTPMNAQTRGYARSAWLESVDYTFKEFQRQAGFGFSLSAGTGPGTKEASGDLALSNVPNAHEVQHPSDGLSASLAFSNNKSGYAVLKNMPKAVTRIRKVPWLRVTADALVTLTFEAKNARDLIRYPGGKIVQKFWLRNALDFGVAPEDSLQLGLVHPRGMPVPSGLFLPSLGHPQVADDDDQSLHAANALPAAPGVFALHVRVDGNNDFVVGNRSLTPAEFHAQVLAHVDLTGKTLVLVTGHGDRGGAASAAGAASAVSAAEALARITKLPVVAAQGPVHVTPDGSPLAVTLDQRGSIASQRGFQRGQWTEIAPRLDAAGTVVGIGRQPLDYHLVQALAVLGFVVPPRPDFVPPLRTLIKR